nr:hypothetical protein B0A51_16174 [Rachicladosporium sp. CCFEE 5018]
MSWLWPFSPARRDPSSPQTAAADPALRAHFLQFLDYVEPPRFFKPSEVAQMLTPAELANLGFEDWREALLGVRVIGWEYREFGDCEVLVYDRSGAKGQGKEGEEASEGKWVVLDEGVGWMEVQGGVRFRRTRTALDGDDWD